MKYSNVVECALLVCIVYFVSQCLQPAIILTSPPSPSPSLGRKEGLRKVCAHFVLGRNYFYYTESDVHTNSNIHVDVTRLYIMCDRS